MEAFEPWLSRLEERIGERAVEEAASEIPPEWYEDKADALEKMLEQLLRRRKLVADLIVAARDRPRNRFRIGSERGPG